MYIGSWKVDDLVTFTVTTHDATTGALTDADSDPSYRVYENETGTAILSGTMALLDDANTTGHYSEQITLSAANGFEKGKSYNIYISAAVDGVTGGTTRALQIEAEVDANTVSPGGMDPSDIRDAIGLASANLDTQLSAIDDFLDTEVAAIKAKTDNLPADPADASDIAASFVTVNGKLDTIDDLIDTEVGTINTNVSTLVTRLGTPSDLGSGATIADNLTDIDAGAGGGLDAAGVRAAVGLAAANLDTQLSTIDTVVDAILVDTGTTLQAELDGIQADTEDIQTRLPAALVSGRIDASVGAMAADTLTASALAADAVTEIQSGLSTLDAAGVRTAVGLASANLDTQLDALPTNAELATALAAADDAVLAAIAALNNLSAAQVNAEVVDALTVDVIADSTPADGSRPTLAQAALMIARFLMEKSVSGTTVTVNKEDGSTAAMTFTLDDASSPTSITRAS